MNYAARKTVVSVQNDNISTPQATWDKIPFEDGIKDHGYSCYIEHSLECPCFTKSVTSPAPDCVSCGGTGRFYIDKTKTRILCSAMNNISKYQPWTAENVGTVSISTRPQDKLGYMDKVTLNEVESWYSQRIYLRKNMANTVLFGFTTYPMLLVYDCYLFQGNDEPLKPLYLNTDFTIEDNKIILNGSYLNTVNPRITVRYVHNPVYFVIDISRDIIRQKNLTNCLDANPLTNLTPANFPLHCTAKKAQYLPEMMNYDGTGVIDNTDYNRTPPNYDY